MKSARPPRYEERRAKEFEAELLERARAWIPQWGTDDDSRDFGRALLKVAARFTSEVAERLDRGGEKLRLGFLDWLAVPTGAARPARLPVVFKLSDSARDAKAATAPTKLQVEAADSSVILETETDVLVLPGGLQVVVGVDGAADAFYLPPPGLSDLAPLEPLPTRWQLKSFASAGATKVQLDPPQGLLPEMLIEIGGQQYRVAEVKKDIVTLDPPLTSGQAAQATVTKVTAFVPFDPAARNRQEHALYLGHKELFDIEAAATIEVRGARALSGVAWHYWGKSGADEELKWQPLGFADAEVQAKAEGLVLTKPKGSMEALELLKGTESRWIRASAPTVDAGQAPLLVDSYEILLNCGHGAPLPSGADAAAAPSIEAMANTTPLVIDSVFFPFGKEPRQFDTFYVGSKEAFSKKGADVTLAFDMADMTFTALTAVREGAFANVLAGVAQDGALYVLELNTTTGVVGKFRDRGSLRPPRGDVNADVSAGLPLDRRPAGRLPVWNDTVDPAGFLVAAGAGDAVWVWRESSASKDASAWGSFGSVPTMQAQSSAVIDDLVYLADASMLFALRGGQLSSRKWKDPLPWAPVATSDNTSGPARAVVLNAIVPILVDSGGSLKTFTVAGMLGISDDKKLYQVTAAGACTPLDVANVDASVRPVAVKQGGELFVTFMRASSPKPVMFHLSGGGGEDDVELVESDAKVVGFDATINNGVVQFMASVQVPSGGYVASWTASVTGNVEPYRADIPSGIGQPAGAPTGLAGRIVVPGTDGHVLVATFDTSLRLGRQGDVGEAVFTAVPAVLATGEFLAREIPQSAGGGFSARTIDETGTTEAGGEAFYLLDDPFSRDASGAVYGFRASPQRTGTFVDEDHIELDAGDSTGDVDTNDLDAVIRTNSGEIHRITSVSSRVATVEPELTDPGGSGTIKYLNGVALSARGAPFLRLDTSNNDWSAALLDYATLRFEGASPVQRGKAFRKIAGNRPELIELSRAWTSLAVPGAGAMFRLDASVGSWARSLEDTATNPELSWEYWNGTGWWKLLVTRDETANLKSSGTLEFKVPRDLAPNDWSGRTNYWIRARLVGGDYGRERVSVAISPPDPVTKVTHQIIERSTADIHAPSVVKLRVGYEICEGVLPTFVFTKESGSWRDQSDANLTAGPKVESFVPVAEMLGRLSGAPATSAATDDCRPDCQCPGAAAAGSPASASSNAKNDAAASTGSAASSSAASAAGTTPASAQGRALYLGFDAPLLGEPLNVLLLVEERPHDQFAPMTVEALIADRFVPVVVNDATRALGESGILTIALPIQPKPRELFGQTLSWLRLSPAPGPSPADWAPKVLGSYLNGVWARAAETLTHELLGSSQGEPNLTLFLARPRVLRNTLELRVKEPLGDEEIAALNAERDDQALTAVEGLPGEWVLWNRVIDPGDEAPDARVYALDEATGQISFGDGQHGKIPPVGRDSIMAFTYRRTEPGAAENLVVPANTITARTPLNLVSPIDGVEAVFAADRAAGGAPPEDVDRVLRFGFARLRHRERAVTAEDVEDLVLASSPDIAQARCFLRNGFVQVVVVMRGTNPIPNAAQVRELQRLLISEAPPSLAAHQALRIVGPALRRLGVDLRLRVASLDDAGAVAREARKRTVALFDTATGGIDGEGWALGENPTDSDVAVILADMPLLEGIADVSFREIADDGTEQEWPASLKRTELPRLEKDGVRIEFETVEVFA